LQKDKKLIIFGGETIEKINTKKELVSLLKKSKGILNNSMISYLNSLINLEFSVIRDYIGENDRITLSELEVYKRIAIYNIYERALRLFKEKDSKLIISGNNDGNEGLNVYFSLGKNSGFELFDFNYRECPVDFKSKIPAGYKTMKIGNVSLFQTIESKDQRESEIIRIQNELEELKKENNPYPYEAGTYGGPNPQWHFEHRNKINLYQEKLNLLTSKKELTDEEKKEIETTKIFHELLLEDYGLTNNDFVEESNKDSLGFKEDKTGLHKTLVKKMPNLIIKDNIKYI